MGRKEIEGLMHDDPGQTEGCPIGVWTGHSDAPTERGRTSNSQLRSEGEGGGGVRADVISHCRSRSGVNVEHLGLILLDGD